MPSGGTPSNPSVSPPRCGGGAQKSIQRRRARPTRRTLAAPTAASLRKNAEWARAPFSGSPQGYVFCIDREKTQPCGLPLKGVLCRAFHFLPASERGTDGQTTDGPPKDIGVSTHRTGWKSVARGFSLVEIMIVVVIIGLMAGLVVYATSSYLERAKRQRARADIATLAGAVDSFYLAKGEYPPSDQGLKALVPEFVKVVQNDPWGNPYTYIVPGKSGPYDIISYGADGREGGTGADADITNSDVEVREARHK
jgi:general secretion pathway protein G